MPSLLDALTVFLGRWKENEALGKHPGVGEGICALCREQRYVQYNIQLDAEFCSSGCAQRYDEIVKVGMTYAG